MKTISLRRIFAHTALLVGMLLALAGTSGYFLLRETNADSTVSGAIYIAVATLSLLATLGVLYRLFRVVAAAIQHDIESLIRTLRDMRDGAMRPAYPVALREFAGALTYLRTSGRKLMREKERLMKLGFIDHLSQLSNRRYFERRLAHLHLGSKNKGPSTVLLIDLDQFKAVNDNYGHDAGDLLIVSFAKALRACVRQTDFLARLGGDEFCVIYPYTPLAKATGYAERLRKQLPREISLSKGIVHKLRWTGGVSAILDADAKFDDVLWRADKALIQAKEAGRNNTKVYDPRLAGEPAVRVLAS